MSKENKLYIRPVGWIHPLVVMVDGLCVTYFDNKGPYVTIEQAIEWVEKECRENPGYAHELTKGVSGLQMLESLRSIKARFDDGELPVDE